MTQTYLNHTVRTLIALMAKADSVVIDSPVLTRWTSSEPTGDPSNVLYEFDWVDDDGGYRVALTEGAIARGKWHADSFFCEDQDGDEVQLTLYTQTPLAPQAPSSHLAGAQGLQVAEPDSANLHPQPGKQGIYRTAYQQFGARNGQPFTLVGTVDPVTYDAADVGPMFSIRFADGQEIQAYPEELDFRHMPKRLLLTLSYTTKKEYSEVVEVPADLSDEEVEQLLQRRYAVVDPGEYVDDPEFIAKGDLRAEPADEADSPTMMAFRVEGGLHIERADASSFQG